MGQEVSPPVRRQLRAEQLRQGWTVIVPFTMSCYSCLANVDAFHDSLRPSRRLEQGNRIPTYVGISLCWYSLHYLLHILTTTWLNFCAFRICLLWWGVRRSALCAIVFFFYPLHLEPRHACFPCMSICLPPAFISLTFSPCCRRRDLFFSSFKSQFYLASSWVASVLGWTIQCYPPLDHFFFCLSCKFRRLARLRGIADWKSFVGQGGYGFVFVSRVFLNSSAGRLDWLLKLSLPGTQDWYRMDGRGGNQWQVGLLLFCSK